MGKGTQITKTRKFNYFCITLNSIVLICLINEAFKVIPSTEGWFIHLTSNKNFFQILINDEILLPPLYPLFINIVNKLSHQLIFLRLIGIAFGFLLYEQTSITIRRGLEILLEEKQNLPFLKISKILGALLIFYIINISSYLIWYDFTIVVLIFQLLIINLAIYAIKSNHQEKSKIYNLTGILLILGILLKHSNMGIYFIFMQFGFLGIAFMSKQERIYIYNLFKWQIIAALLIFISLNIYIFLSKNYSFYNFLDASLNAKGGAQIVGKFVLNGFNHIFNEIKRFEVIFMGLCIYVYFKNLKIWGLNFIFIYNFLWSYFIIKGFYNLSGFSVQAISILVICNLFYCFERLILNFRSLKSFRNDNIFLFIFLYTTSSLGCLIGNFTSAGLGYNGYYIGLIIGIILQICFLSESLSYLNKKLFNHRNL